MTYKNKHLKKLIPVAAAATLAMSMSSCEYKFKSTKEDTTEQGLLSCDKTTADDIYGTEVVFQSVDIPTYYANGNRMKNCFVLTRGQAPELFADYQVKDLSIQRVYLNESKRPFYIMTGKFNEVVDENGRFVGLVVDGSGRTVAVAPKNLKAYIEECQQTLNATPNTSAPKKLNSHIDTVKIVTPADSAAKITDDSLAVDSVIRRNVRPTFTEKQFTDTLSALAREHE